MEGVGNGKASHTWLKMCPNVAKSAEICGMDDPVSPLPAQQKFIQILTKPDRKLLAKQ